jgi:hypothetical protein
LRKRFAQLEMEHKLKKIDADMFNRSGCEVLLALRKLGEPLDAAETAFLERHSTGRHLTSTAGASVATASLLDTASENIAAHSTQ